MGSAEKEHAFVPQTLNEVARKSLIDLCFDQNASPILRKASVDALKQIVKAPQKAAELEAFQADIAAK